MDNYNPFSLVGKTILVTGASSGIGRAIAIECSRMGASVVITARNEERLSETLSMLESGNHSAIIADLGSSKMVVLLCLPLALPGWAYVHRATVCTVLPKELFLLS